MANRLCLWVKSSQQISVTSVHGIALSHSKCLFFFFQVSPALGASQRNVSELWCRPYLHELSVAMAATRSWCEETTPFPELCSACGEGPGWMFLSSILTGGLVCTDIGVGNWVGGEEHGVGCTVSLALREGCRKHFTFCKAENCGEPCLPTILIAIPNQYSAHQCFKESRKGAT